jgi:ATP-dependent RNA helicase DeaD
LIDKMENVEINHEQIESFLPDIHKKLESLDKEDLIKRFVSLEFNRFLEYYKKAPDLNVLDERDSGQRERRERGGRRANNGDFKRLFVNVGKNHGLNPQRLMGLVNEATGENNIEIGRIDVMKSFSFFEIDKQHTDKVLDVLNEAVFEGVSVSTEIAKERQAGGGGGDRDSRRGGDSRSSGGGDRGRSSGGRSERRSSGGDRYGRSSSGRSGSRSGGSGGGERSSGGRSGGSRTGGSSSGGARRSRPRK